MQTKTKNLRRLILRILPIFVIVSIALVGTVGRYVSRATPSDTARVAKFDIEITAPNFNNYPGLVDTNAPLTISTVYAAYKPFTYRVKNNSEVTVKVTAYLDTDSAEYKRVPGVFQTFEKQTSRTYSDDFILSPNGGECDISLYLLPIGRGNVANVYFVYEQVN